MSEHSKGPWRVRERRDRDGELLDCFVEAPAVEGMAYGLEVLGDDYNGFGDVEQKLKDASRIVACVNACLGLSTDDLEKNGLASAFGNQLLEVDRQRDKLLAAIVDVLDGTPIDDYNRDADGMGFSFNRDDPRIEKWRKRLHDVRVQVIEKIKGGAA